MTLLWRLYRLVVSVFGLIMSICCVFTGGRMPLFWFPALLNHYLFHQQYPMCFIQCLLLSIVPISIGPPELELLAIGQWRGHAMRAEQEIES